MQLSSASLALSLLKYDASVTVSAAYEAVSGARAQMRRNELPAPTLALAGSADIYVPQPIFNYPEFMMTLALASRMVEASVKGRNGDISPFDTGATGRGLPQPGQDPRMEFEGVFPPSVSVAMGSTAPQRDANFPSRSDGMAYAYRFGTKLAEFARQAVVDTAAISANRDRMLDASGKIHGVAANGRLLGSWDAMVAADAYETHDIVANMFNMEVQAASLANLFSFDSASVTAPAYQGRFEGFSIRHGSLGNVMDVAADGAVTLYGADGTAHSAAAYSAANVDGGIPQLRNDMIRQADRQRLFV